MPTCGSGRLNRSLHWLNGLAVMPSCTPGRPRCRLCQERAAGVASLHSSLQVRRA